MINLRNNIKNIASLLVGIVGHHFGSKILDHSNNAAETERMNDLNNKIDNLQVMSQSVVEKLDVISENSIPKESIIKDLIKKLIDRSDNGNTLLPNYNLDFLYDYLDSLTLLQESAFFHIAVLLAIGLTVFNILSVIAGNQIIDYFKLEVRYPKLAGFFRLRLKFQKYYLVLNFSLIFLIIFWALLLNLLVLFKL